MRNKKIEYLKPDDIGQVVEIYHRELPGFLSRLGPDFLNEFYKVSLGVPEMLTFVYKEKGEVLGFASGVNGLKGINRRIIMKHPIKFGYLLLKHIITHPADSPKMMKTLGYPGFSGEMPELLTIAVSKKHRGKGIGRKLLKAVSEEFKKRGKKQFLVSVYDRLPANIFYLKTGGKLHKSFDFLGGKMNYYLYELRES
jgi:ribosomal protein S18 acetylase RimI-like enzyme